MTIDLFLESMKSDKTRQTYEYALSRFIQWAKIAVDLKDVPAKDIQMKLIEYTVTNKTKSASWQNVVISAVQKYCEAYDVDINFKKVRRYLKEDDTNTDDRAYTIEEIRSMLDASDKRKKAVILLLTSTGIRAGAIESLRIKDLVKMDGLYMVNVYATSKKSKYYTFTTPECAQAIDAYLEYRKLNGETISPSDPLIREEFDSDTANTPKTLKTDGVNTLLLRLLRKNGLRKDKKNGRFSVHQMHGFRKLFHTSLVRAGVKPVVAEMLMGHSTGLNQNYLRLDVKEAREEYLKCISMLTVSDEKQLQVEVEKLQTEIADIDVMKRQYLGVKAQLEAKDSQITQATDANKLLVKMLISKGILKPEDAEALAAAPKSS